MLIDALRFSDSYVEHKLGKKHWIQAVDRATLCEAAINEENLQDWIAVSRAEGECPKGFVDFDDVAKELTEFVNRERQSSLSPLKHPLKVVYICGLDHFNRCSYVAQIAEQPNLACVVIYRPHADEKTIGTLQEQNSNVYYFDLNELRHELKDISSTMIREGDPNGLQHLTYDAVIAYLKNRH